tara:strand:- start:315 stop:1808 length:1494 start_codon:yes stop_codon:yes gene_type:complete
MATTREVLEQILEQVAEKLIQSEYYTNADVVKANQKTIKNGIITIGRQSSDKQILYSSDISANFKDAQETISTTHSLNSIAQIIAVNSFEFTITVNADPKIILATTPGTSTFSAGIEIQDAITGAYGDDTTNSLNVNQFVDLVASGSSTNQAKANEFLDTNIFELLPGDQTRQQRITTLFNELNTLLGNPPVFEDIDGDALLDPTPNTYTEDHDISYAQETDDVDTEDKFITRLQSDENSDFTGQSIESLRELLNSYLVDIDQNPIGPQDVRPEYENQSDGYLKFRKLNQSIIIRNTNTKYVTGLNPETKDYLETGFTITMWVRFLDKVSEGTLFNFGNPTRVDDYLGFKLDTLTYEGSRFLRLLVYDGEGLHGEGANGVARWYDSHLGMPGVITPFTLDKKNIISPEVLNEVHPTQYTEVPTDFTEWYFICATYNPNIDEISSLSSGLPTEPEYWLNHLSGLDGFGGFTHNSGYGNRSKVEIISRSDLLRARGFKV